MSALSVGGNVATITWTSTVSSALFSSYVVEVAYLGPCPDNVTVQRQTFESIGQTVYTIRSLLYYSQYSVDVTEGYISGGSTVASTSFFTPKTS